MKHLINKFKYFHYHRKNFNENFCYESTENKKFFLLFLEVEIEIEREKYKIENILLNKLVVKF